jgi:hypothetical protein
MPNAPLQPVATLGIDIGKNSFHLIGLDARGAIVLRQKLSPGQVEARLANMPTCLIGMEACVGAHHLSRQLLALGHDVKLIPAQFVSPFRKSHKTRSWSRPPVCCCSGRPSGPSTVSGTGSRRLRRGCITTCSRRLWPTSWPALPGAC